MKVSDVHEKAVLVVEDNPDDVLLLRLAAKEECPDISFVFVRDGPEALAYLGGEGQMPQGSRPRLPSLALVDARLPKMDGLKLVRRIRESPELADLKVLLWSDGYEPSLKERAEAAGVTHFMRKPLAFTELMQMVRGICQLARTE